MNETPTPVGVSSLWEVLEQMNEIPEVPHSALVACDDEHVFVSFHWDKGSAFLARKFAAQLTVWLKEQLLDWGATTVEEVDGGLNG